MHILYSWAYWQYPEVAIEFLERIKNRGNRVSVLLGSNYPNLNEKYNSVGNFYFLPSLDLGTSFLRSPYPILRNVSNFIKKLNPDIVHVNSHLFYSNFQVTKASLEQNIPTVATIHGLIAKRGKGLNLVQELYLKTIAKSLLKSASAIICLTKDDANRVTDIIKDGSKIRVIPNAVDTQFFKPLSKDPATITWVGRIVEEKGLIYLLEAMAKVNKEFGDAQLLLIGEGPLTTKLRTIANKLGLSEKIVFVGSINRKEVARLLGMSSIFVFPSLKEGMPLSVLEAMSSGNAIVASDIRGINDIITDGRDGILVQTKKPDKLARSIIEILFDDKLKNRLSENARKTAIDNHSWESIMIKLQRVYEDVKMNKKDFY